ncbi:MAG: hypothetical protein BWK80_29270 [Desulfobacteraceae bacterium IS3]|nr:MAG: hypothetical protein BWK80_29270 [Desulfobacteraceae bacterium IS3]
MKENQSVPRAIPRNLFSALRVGFCLFTDSYNLLPENGQTYISEIKIKNLDTAVNLVYLKKFRLMSLPASEEHYPRMDNRV